MYVATLEAPLSGMTIHILREAQIPALKQNEASTKVPNEYSDFSDVFSEEKILMLPEQTDLNEHAMKLKDGKQPLYRQIYSLGPVEREILKTWPHFIWQKGGQQPLIVCELLGPE